MSENKVIDESKQGEALMVEVPVVPNGKKLFDLKSAEGKGRNMDHSTLNIKIAEVAVVAK